MEELSFEEMFENSMKRISRGSVVDGTVIDIDEEGNIYVNIGYKKDGRVERNEYSFNDLDDPKKDFKSGDTISVYVINVKDVDGYIPLSHKRIRIAEVKKEFEEKVNNDETFNLEVISVNKNGLIVAYRGIRIFIPSSLTGLRRDEDLNELKGKNVEFKVIEYIPEKNKIVGSIRKVTEKARLEAEVEFWDNVEVGDTFVGTVTNVSNYGAFVDLGGIQGLLHVSKMAWNKNVKPEEMFNIGDKVNVKVIDFNHDERKVSLDSLDKGEDPWEKLTYNVGDVINVKIIKFMEYGIFVEILDGIDGLVHISEISDKSDVNLEDEFKIGQEINVKILEINKENKRIGLSIKELSDTSYDLANSENLNELGEIEEKDE